MYQAGLILEGGGMKGVYTAGVIDFFLDKGIEFSSVYGVSAGACSMCSYLSKQRRRAFDVCVDYLGDKNYCSIWSLLTTGDLFNAEMNYHLVPEYLNPYDYEAFRQYKGKAYSVATDIVSGKPVYFRIRDVKKDIIKIRASASLPLVSRNVKIDGGLYLRFKRLHSHTEIRNGREQQECNCHDKGDRFCAEAGGKAYVSADALVVLALSQGGGTDGKALSEL